MANSNVKVNISTDFDSAGAKAAERELRRVANMQMAASREMAAAEAKAAAQRKAALGTVSNAAAMLGLAMTAAAGAAIAMSAKFDYAMSAVGATGVQNLDALRDAAMQAGRDTAYSAIEAAQGIEQLAKAGLAAEDILGGGLVATLDLAAAGELEVARASEITAVTLKQFSLSGEDAAHVADLLAAGANKAVGGVEDLAGGLEYVGPVAAQMGVSIEETTGALAMFAEQGILGEKAGTGLRGVLMSLTAPSAAASRAMDEYGISVFDATGNFIGLAGMAEQLRTKLGPLDEATRSAALGQIFGNAQITAARILYAGGADAVEGWTAAVDEAGYASEMAAMRLDNLQGDLQILRGSLETMMISLGESAQGPLRALAQGATTAVNAFAEMPPAAQSALLAIAGGGGLGLLGAAGVMKLTTAIGEAKVAMTALGWTAKGVTLATVGIGGVLAIAGIALAKFAEAQAEAKARVDGYTQSLDEQTGAITKNTRAMAAKNLEDAGALEAATLLGIATHDLVSAVLGEGDAYERVQAQLDGYNNSMDQNAADREAQRTAILGVYAALGRESESLRDAQEENERVQEAVEGTAEAHDVARAAMEAQVQSIEDLIDALDNLNGANQSAEQAEINWAKQVEETKAVLDEGVKTLELSSEAGRENRQAMLDMAQAAEDLAEKRLEQTGNEEQFRQTIDQAREALYAQARQFFATDQEAWDYVNTLLKVPSDVSTNVSAPGLARSVAEADALLQRLAALDGRRTYTYVGTVYSSTGTPVSRTQGAMLAQADGGLVRYYASGGMESHVAQIAPAGSWRVWAEPETGGEAYIPLAPSKRARSLDIWAETGRLLGVGGGGGGLTRADLDYLADRIVGGVVYGIDRGVENGQRAASMAGRR